MQSRIDDAILWLEKARAAAPELPWVHLRLASAYALKGETERATAELAEARRTDHHGRDLRIARLKVGFSPSRKIDALLEPPIMPACRRLECQSNERLMFELRSSPHIEADWWLDRNA